MKNIILLTKRDILQNQTVENNKKKMVKQMGLEIENEIIRGYEQQRKSDQVVKWAAILACFYFALMIVFLISSEILI